MAPARVFKALHLSFHSHVGVLLHRVSVVDSNYSLPSRTSQSDLAERCPDSVEAAQIKGGGDYIFSRDPCLFLWLGCTSRDRAGLRAYTFARPCGGHARRLGWAGSAPPPLVGADRSPNLLLLEEAVPQSAAIGRRSGEQLLLLVQSWHGLRHSARHRLAPASGLRQAPSRCHSLPVMESHGKGSSGPPPPGF
ncbi:LOW QUALITY PROTEIN: hypothetical protein SORBI_3001G091200 [Sorghum bicolor]|uniref:Uncharacterized protein n=1 Tax=Sorghum bicolor TaxID=4558 RepID=A0A1B6QI12_SORBI|nr:LOW QUALITY PROTEIN: hypothetical protein SORBI_3001G091200 [Sorghum bicolor]